MTRNDTRCLTQTKSRFLTISKKKKLYLKQVRDVNAYMDIGKKKKKKSLHIGGMQ